MKHTRRLYRKDRFNLLVVCSGIGFLFPGGVVEWFAVDDYIFKCDVFDADNVVDFRVGHAVKRAVLDHDVAGLNLVGKSFKIEHIAALLACDVFQMDIVEIGWIGTVIDIPILQFKTEYRLAAFTHSDVTHGWDCPWCSSPPTHCSRRL